MSIRNYPTPPEHELILDLINAKYQKEMEHIFIYLESTAFESNNIVELLYSRGYGVDSNTYQVYLTMRDGVKRVHLPEWKAEVREHMARLGATYHELLSTALSSRHSLTLVFNLDGVYYSVASTPSSDMYKQTLATMLLDCTDNPNLVLRITDAIQNSEELELINEERTMISKYKMQGALDSIANLCTTSMKAEHSNDRISELENKIRRHTNSILEAEKTLRELRLKQFALNTMTNQDESIVDLQEYLKDISEDILDVNVTIGKHETSTLKITMKSHMYIPETDSDFFKPNAMQSPNHTLYNKPNATKLLQAVMNQEVRLPIVATYRMIISSDGKVYTLDGLPDWETSGRDPANKSYTINQHIDRYNCFDGYKRMMTSAYNENNFIAFFETMRQCTASINVFDSTVMYHIVRAVESYKGPVLVKTDEGWKNMKVEEYLNENTQTE